MLTEARNCVVKRKVWVSDPERMVYLIHDTASLAQACVAFILCNLFQQASWICQLLHTQGSNIVQKAVSIVLISSGLIINPLCVRYVAV
jgi:small neutral amino acid transporter SnatA (MarC family)